MAVMQWRIPSIILILLPASALPLAAEDPFFPPHSMVAGQPMGTWANEWWKWVYSIPFPENPVVDRIGINCGVGQSGEVFFLAGTFGLPAVRDQCVVPEGKFLFFPILNSQATDPDCSVSCDRAVGRHKAASVVNCEIDGVPVPDLETFLESSPECFSAAIPENNILGRPPGTVENLCTVGHYIMLKPLSPGLHVIHFDGLHGDPLDPSFQLEVTYFLEVANVAAAPRFRRGDSNGDGEVNLSDPIRVLERLFASGDPLPCEDAADFDDNGELELQDPIDALYYLFLGRKPAVFPGPGVCGTDLIADALEECQESPACLE